MILHGRRLVQLQKWLHLSVSEKLVQNGSAFTNSFSSIASTVAADVSIIRDSRKGQNFTVSYLVGSLGLTTKLAESISKKVSFEDKSNPDSVLGLLRSHGFTDSQISSIVTGYPTLLIADAEESLGPKLKFLQSRVASSSELTETISKIPKILRMKGDQTISVYFDFVRVIVEADKSSKYTKLCHSLPEGSRQENKIRNILVLRELGVPQRLLFPLLISDNQPVCGKERFEESLKKVVEMGFDPTTSKFVEALRVFYESTEKAIEEKVNVYKRLGLTVSDVWAMFKKWPISLTHSEKKISSLFETFVELGFTRDEFVLMVKRQPSCLNLSVETVKKKIEFLVKEMNWRVEALVSSPQVLGYSLEKRILPRCKVIKALMSKGLLGDKGSKLPPMHYVLKIGDHDFLDRYVRKQDDKDLVGELMAMLTGDDAS
ncbi:transcription termination factor MTERF15, mitochondrial [Capsella rubella]|nr:transcription termination factor MTERF15, mitochondrial [Capsella rubella]